MTKGTQMSSDMPIMFSISSCNFKCSEYVFSDRVFTTVIRELPKREVVDKSNSLQGKLAAHCLSNVTGAVRVAGLEW